MIGTEGNDVLQGTSGADVLDGKGGVDVLYGYGGDDTYYVDNAADFVVEAVGGGNDTVITSTSYQLAAGQEVELLRTYGSATTAAINLTGNAFANILAGNAAANVLDGKAGADVLYGYGGNDTYYVDDAADFVVEAVGGGNDTVITSTSYQLGAGQEVELLRTYGSATTAAINLTGNAFANTLAGNAAANVLDGKGGADVLYGYGGDDTYYVDNAADRVFETAGGGNDTVITSTSYQLGAGQEVEFLRTYGSSGTAAINLTGNEFANTLAGNAAANVLDGKAGADVLYGYDGNDTYYVDNAADFVVEAVGGGNDTVITSTSYQLAAGQEVELLRTYGSAGTAAINLTGNEFANTLVGNAAANILDGKGGADLLYGYGGSDTFAFTSTLGAGNVDTLADFKPGEDKIALDQSVFTGLALGKLATGAFRQGTTAQDGDDRILYDSSTGNLYFDADGDGAAAAVRFATLKGAPAVTAQDFSVSSSMGFAAINAIIEGKGTAAIELAEYTGGQTDLNYLHDYVLDAVVAFYGVDAAIFDEASLGATTLLRDFVHRAVYNHPDLDTLENLFAAGEATNFRTDVGSLFRQEAWALCGEIATQLHNVFRAFGYDSRIAWNFNGEDGNGTPDSYDSGHVTVEVFVDNQDWIVQDPTFNFVFEDEAGNLLDLKEARDINVFSPSDLNIATQSVFTYVGTVNVLGWPSANEQYFRDNYLGVFFATQDGGIGTYNGRAPWFDWYGAHTTLQGGAFASASAALAAVQSTTGNLIERIDALAVEHFAAGFRLNGESGAVDFITVQSDDTSYVTVRLDNGTVFVGSYDQIVNAIVHRSSALSIEDQRLFLSPTTFVRADGSIYSDQYVDKLEAGYVALEVARMADPAARDWPDGTRTIVSLDEVSGTWVYDYYDSEGRQVRQGANYEDGGYLIVQFDWANAYIWSDNQLRYDSAGTLVAQRFNYDAGGYLTTEYDASNVFAWSDNQLRYDSSGLLVAQRYNYDEGGYLDIQYDAANVQSWSENQLRYDASGTLLVQWLQYDNGSDTIVSSISYALPAGQEIELLQASTSTISAINLTGNEFANTLVGNDGANVLDGKGGADVLWGHGGADSFMFTSAPGAGNIDAIRDFQTGVDRIVLDSFLFGGLHSGALDPGAFRTGAAAQDADDRILYDPATGALYFDPDGIGGAAAMQFAELGTALNLAASDFTVMPSALAKYEEARAIASAAGELQLLPYEGALDDLSYLKTYVQAAAANYYDVDPSIFETPTTISTSLLRDFVHKAGAQAQDLPYYSDLLASGEASVQYDKDVAPIFRYPSTGFCGLFAAQMYEVFRAFGFEATLVDLVDGQLGVAGIGDAYQNSHVTTEVYLVDMKHTIIQDATVNGVIQAGSDFLNIRESKSAIINSSANFNTFEVYIYYPDLSDSLILPQAQQSLLFDAISGLPFRWRTSVGNQAYFGPYEMFADGQWPYAHTGMPDPDAVFPDAAMAQSSIVDLQAHGETWGSAATELREDGYYVSGFRLLAENGSIATSWLTVRLADGEYLSIELASGQTLSGSYDQLVIEAVGKGDVRNPGVDLSLFLSPVVMLAYDGEIRSDWEADGSFPNLGTDGPDVLGGTSGADVLNGKGGADLLYGYGGNDTYLIDNAGDRVREVAGGGYDTVITSTHYLLPAAQEIELLRTYGSAGTTAINLTGNAFANTIVGNDGTNVLDGQGGADQLYGYGGADTFAFTSALGAGNVDTIGDFQSGLDRIALDDAIFGGMPLGPLAAGAFRLGTAAQDADDRILYDSATGAVYFDPDGIGGAAAVHFANLSAPPLAGDFLVI